MPKYSHAYNGFFESKVTSKKDQKLVSEFLGLPINQSRSYLRKAKSFDSLIDIAFKKYKVGEDRPHQAIMENWKDIVGSKNAHRCTPTNASAHSLTVSVSNPIIRSELQFNKRNILNKIRALPGCENISSLSFLAG